MRTQRWTVRSSEAQRTVSKKNWDKRNHAGKTRLCSTPLLSYQVDVRLLVLMTPIVKKTTTSSSMSYRIVIKVLFLMVLCSPGVRLMKGETRLIHLEDEEKETKK